MRSVFVILLSTFIAACSTLQQPSRTYVEALIRHELSSPKSYLSSNRQTYYVGVVSRDLSAAEISALSATRSEEHTSELQSLLRPSYAVFCLKKKQFSPYYPHTTTQY